MLSKRHIFYTRLKTYAKHNELSFERFIKNLNNLDIKDIENMLQNLPEEWYNQNYADKIVTHCNLILSNVNKFRRGLLEVFA